MSGLRIQMGATSIGTRVWLGDVEITHLLNKVLVEVGVGTPSRAVLTFTPKASPADIEGVASEVVLDQPIKVHPIPDGL